jgi:hypothetical protein
MQRDGLMVTFTHRSFQEYFSAAFITRNPPIDIPVLLDSFCSRTEDNVISMAFDMNRDLVERTWVNPRLQELAYRIHELPSDNLIAVGSIAVGTLGLVSFSQRERVRCHLILVDRREPAFVLAFTRLYPKLFRGVFEPLRSMKEEECVEIAKHVDSYSKSGREREYALSERDNEWVGSTQIGEHLRRFRSALLKAADTVKKSVEECESSGRSLVFASPMENARRRRSLNN